MNSNTNQEQNFTTYIQEIMNIIFNNNNNFTQERSNNVDIDISSDTIDYNIPRLFRENTQNYLMEWDPLTRNTNTPRYTFFNNLQRNNNQNTNNLQDFINETLLLDKPKYKLIASEKGLNEIVKGYYNDTMEYSECPITREEFKVGDEISILPCNHYFTPGEIKIWLNESNKCPICRYELDSVEIKIEEDEINNDVSDNPIPGNEHENETRIDVENISQQSSNQRLNIIPHSYIQYIITPNLINDEDELIQQAILESINNT